MNPVTLYRMQDATGRGPFAPGFTMFWFDGRTEAEAEALAPFDHGKVHAAITSRPIWCRHTGYACENLETLRRWFLPDEYRMLITLGFQAMAMPDCTILLSSPLQVLFGRRRPLAMDATPVVLYGNSDSTL